MEQNETLENDDVLEFDYTGTDQAGNLATMKRFHRTKLRQPWRRSKALDVNTLTMRYGISGHGLTLLFCRS